MKYRPPIRGKVLKKKPEVIQVPDTVSDIEGLVQVVDELTTIHKENFKKLETDLTDAVEQKLEEVDQAIEEIKKIEPLPGKDADEEAIIEKVLERIPAPEKGKEADPVDQKEIIDAVLSKIVIPTPIDEKKLIKKILASLPEKEGTLKIIRETIETDPMAIIDKILALPSDKFKLKSENIDGLEQTISAFKNQLGARGYVHGGGISDITGLIQQGTNVTITGSGTKGSPYVINASGSGMSPLTTKGDLYTFSTLDTRLPVGPDGFLLSSDSGQSTGLKWVTPPASMAIGGTVTGGTQGSLLFIGSASTLQQDNPNLFWDDTNNRLGIGTTTPAAPLDIRSPGGSNHGIHLEATGANSYAPIDFYNDVGLSGQFLATGSTFSNGDIGPNEVVLASEISDGKLGLGSLGAAGSIYFFTGGFSGNKRMVIDSLGNIGIKNTTPFSGVNAASGSLWAGTLGGNDGNVVAAGGYATLGKISAGSYGGVGFNWYLDNAGTGRALYADKVSLLEFTSGGFRFYGAPATAINAVPALSLFAQFDNSGIFTVTTLDTGLTPPTQSGTIGVVTSDDTGLLSFVLGATGTFTTVDLKTVTVTNGVITAIV